MDYHTTSEWDEARWRKAKRVYQQAFPEHGRKSDAIIRRMFERRMCFLHTAQDGEDTVGMALSGIVEEANVLILDYLAISEHVRGKGYGRLFMSYIKDWAESAANCNGIVIEVEAEPTPDNIRRIRFWEQCGFRLTDYVLHYIWVPEPYRAMYIRFRPDSGLPEDGETLFKYITQFHKAAYRGKA